MSQFHESFLQSWYFLLYLRNLSEQYSTILVFDSQCLGYEHVGLLISLNTMIVEGTKHSGGMRQWIPIEVLLYNKWHVPLLTFLVNKVFKVVDVRPCVGRSGSYISSCCVAWFMFHVGHGPFTFSILMILSTSTSGWWTPWATNVSTSNSLFHWSPISKTISLRNIMHIHNSHDFQISVLEDNWWIDDHPSILRNEDPTQNIFQLV